MRHSLLTGAVTAATCATASVAYAGPMLELVIKNTDQVPGIAGVAWATGSSQFQGPSIDQSGSVAFRGTLLTGTGGVTTSNNSTMFYGTPGSLNLFARTGSQAPGLPAGVNSVGFQSQNVALSPNGNLWFGGTTTAPSGYVATGTFSALNNVARNGDTLPGVTSPLNFNPASSTGYQQVNNAGQTLILGQMADNTIALWVGGPGTLQKVFHRGTGDAGLPSGTTIGSVSTSLMNGGGSVITAVQMNLGSGIVYGNNEVVAVRPWGGSQLNVIAREAEPAPGFGPGVFYPSSVFDSGLGFDPTSFNFSHGNYNNGGSAVFSTNVTGTGITPGTNSASIFAYDGSSTSLFRQQGDAFAAVPGATLGLTSTDATRMRLNNGNQIAWTPNLTIGPGGVTSATRAVLLSSTLGSSVDNLIARQGSTIAAVPGALMGSFSNLLQNNAGQIVFSTTLTDDLSDPNDNVTSGNDLALFAWDPVGGLMLIAREGDSLASIGANLTLTGSWLTMFNAANIEGGANALSDNGWLTFRATGTALPGFSDTAAIVRVQIPAPGPVVLFAGGVMALVGKRRRS